MAKAKRPVLKKKPVVKKVVNPVTHVKRIVKPSKRKGGKPIVCYSMTMLCPPQICSVCHAKVVAQTDGTYHCPRCPNTWRCASCDA